MKYIIETESNKKIGIFSDLHVGVSSDSKVRLEETLKCVDWIINSFKENKVDIVIFCGDLFNSRYSVNVNTLNFGISIVERLSKTFNYVVLIAGNHDIYYKNTNEINSVSFLEKISNNNNIFVVANEAEFIKIGNKTLGLYPWGFDNDKVKEIENYQIPDYGFGHFELNGIELTGSISSGSKYNLKDMFSLGKVLFSGHYHGNKIYKCMETQSFLYMIGSPLQLDWGDYSKEKKILTFTPENGEINEIQNEINARFEKIFYSDFENKKYSKVILERLCRKNFVKFVIDCQYKFDVILKITNLIKKYEPASLELDYLISFSNGVIVESADEMIKTNAKTNKDYLLDYIKCVYPEYKKIDDSIELEYLKEMAVSYYNEAVLPPEERNQKSLED